jgi:hypothetical protein
MTAGFSICLDAEREAALIELSRAQRQPKAQVNLLAAVRQKWTIDADGNWIERPAHEIDGTHPLAQCDLTVTQEPEKESENA